MKIVKGVGEKVLPRWLRAELRPVLVFTGAGTTLLSGSVALAQRGWDELRERLSFWESIAALAAGAYVGGYGCWHSPHIARFAIPGALLAWCVAACWAAPPAKTASRPVSEAAVEQPPSSAPDDVYAATLEWIRQQVGDRQGVHLRDLLEHAQAHGMFTDLQVSDLRTHLERWRIPVRNKVRVRGLGVTVGIYRDDLPPLPEALPDPDGPDPPNSELHPA